jgi:probable F420-dependent oxidoreductase
MPGRADRGPEDREDQRDRDEEGRALTGAVDADQGRDECEVSDEEAGNGVHTQFVDEACQRLHGLGYSHTMSDALPLDVELVGVDAADIARLARRAEDAGFARIWAPELYRSATIPLAIAAGATERIELATGIALAFTRSPFVLALEALDLDELSGGRMVIGLGAGVRRLNERWHAVSAYDPPVTRMREHVAAVREIISALSAGRDARSKGTLVDIHVAGYRRQVPTTRETIPVWLAAVMPGMARLAGRIADGFLDHPITTPEWLAEQLLPAIDAGAEAAERGRPAIAAGLIVAASDADPDAARRAAACTVGFYATVKTYEPLFQHHGFDALLPRIRRAFMEGGDRELADAVGQDMLDTFAAAGTVGEVRSRAERYDGRVDRLWLTPPHHLQSPAATTAWQEALLDAFAVA